LGAARRQSLGHLSEHSLFVDTCAINTPFLFVDYFGTGVLGPGPGSAEHRVHFHDLHATVLYLLGLDHTKLTYRYSGRDYRLTDVYGKVVRGIVG
jgi:hypothetical protein